MTTKKSTKEKASQASEPPAASATPEASTPPTKESSAVESNNSDPKAEKSQDKEKTASGKVKSDKITLRKKLEPYFESHPKVDVFYVTSDGTLFFEKQWAREHQKTLDPQKEFETVNR